MKKLKLKQKILILVVATISIFELTAFPAPILAKDFHNQKVFSKDFVFSIDIKENKIEKKEKIIKFIGFPKSKEVPVVKTGFYIITAYNSEVNQCDNSPCITANGFNVCEHGIEDTIAANFLKFGTKVRIPSLFGSKVFIVRDRMNKRYNNRVDVWMLNKKDALKLGRKIAKIEILR